MTKAQPLVIEKVQEASVLDQILQESEDKYSFFDSVIEASAKQTGCTDCPKRALREEVKAMIRENAERFNMKSWYSHVNVNTLYALSKDFHSPVCKTTGCIAGFVGILRPTEAYSPFSGKNLGLDTVKIADMLGVRAKDPEYSEMHGSKLFNHSFWPSTMFLDYEHALNNCDYAKAAELACQAIDYFVTEEC